MRALIAVWRRHRVLVSCFVLALLLTLFFLVRMVMFSIYWADPAHRDQSLSGWMTPRYVQMSWHVPPDVIQKAIGLPDRGGHQSLEQIAESQGVPLDELIAKLEAAIAASRGAAQ
jgi:hypothetical protein